MNILVLAVNAKYTHTCLAAYIIKKSLNERKIPCGIFEANVNDRLRDIVFTTVQSKASHILFPMYIWNSKKVCAIANDLRKLIPDTILITGGPEAQKEGYIDSGLFDIVVSGECEAGIADLILSSSGDKENLSGKIEFPIADFANTPFPYTQQDLKSFKHKITYYESMRGCPYSCGYCISGSTGFSKIVKKPIRTVIADIESFLETPPKMVKFVDRTFNMDKKHAHAIWKYLAELPGSAPCLTFQFELHPGLINEDDIALLSEIPPERVQLEIGVQSITKEVLEASGRTGQSDWPKIRKMLRRLNAFPNIRTHLDQIVGLPYSDTNEAVFSMNEILSTKPDYFQLGFLKILHNTNFKTMSKDFGFLYSSEPPYEVYKTRWLSAKDMTVFHRIEWAIDAIYNSRLFTKTIDYLTKHDSFRFFNDFADYYIPNDYREMPGRKWETIAGSILSMYKGSNDWAEVKDLLLLDWCGFSKSSVYPKNPSLIPSWNTTELRNRIWEYLKKDEFSQLDGDYSMRLFNMSILYIPETETGKKAADGTHVLFIPNKNKKSGNTGKKKIVLKYNNI